MASRSFVFIQPNSNRLHPPARLRAVPLARLPGLPPIRLHDPHHGAVPLVPAAGVEMEVVQKAPGHTFSPDTYTSVYP